MNEKTRLELPLIIALTNTDKNRNIRFVPYRENFTVEINPGDTVTLSIRTAEQGLYYLLQANKELGLDAEIFYGSSDGDCDFGGSSEDIADLLSEVKSIGSKANQNTNDITNLKTNDASQDSKLSELQQAINQLNVKVTAIDINTLNTKISNLEKSVLANSNSINEIKSDYVKKSELIYSSLTQKPRINGVELDGNKTTEELGIVSAGGDAVSPTYIIISDSYGGRDTDGVLTSHWENNLCEHLNKTEGVDFFYGWYGGSGFSNGYFLQIIKEMLGDTSTIIPEYKSMGTIDTTKQTVIVVVGGWNDVLASSSQIRTGQEAFADYVASKFSNYQVKLAFVAWGDTKIDSSHDVNYYDNISKTLSNYIISSSIPNWSYLNNIEYCLHKTGLWQTDGYHPNNNAQPILATYLAQALKTGCCDIHYVDNDTATITPMTNGLITSNDTNSINMQSRLINGQLTLKMSAGQVLCDETKIVSSTGFGDWVNLGTVYDLKYVRGYGSRLFDNWVSQVVYARYLSDKQTTSNWGLLPVLLRINKGVLQGFFTAIDHTTNTYHTNLKIKAIQFPGFVVTLNSMVG